MEDEEIRNKIIQMITEAIQNSLRDSQELSNALELAGQEGYEIVLSVFSGILLHKRDDLQDKSEEEETLPAEEVVDTSQREEGFEPSDQPVSFELNQLDIEFLKSLGLTLE
ncbi:MAG TPA: hypothetical protein VNM22_19820 [Candidatus Limnocylindrales bacterium]|nr:hypothetical protein [Candidatus Limnocylindrales bacterium]